MTGRSYTVHEIGEGVGADDASFCGIVLEVRVHDSGGPAVTFAEKWPEHEWQPPVDPNQLYGDPTDIILTWEPNCSNEPLARLGRAGARRLAADLLAAAAKADAILLERRAQS